MCERYRQSGGVGGRRIRTGFVGKYRADAARVVLIIVDVLFRRTIERGNSLLGQSRGTKVERTAPDNSHWWRVGFRRNPITLHFTRERPSGGAHRLLFPSLAVDE